MRGFSSRSECGCHSLPCRTRLIPTCRHGYQESRRAPAYDPNAPLFSFIQVAAVDELLRLDALRGRVDLSDFVEVGLDHLGLDLELRLQDLDLVSASPPPLRARLFQPQQRFDPLLVEPDNRLAVDDGDRDLLSSEIFQLLKRLHVLADVLFDEGDAFLRKKLFLPVAAPSPRAGIDHDRFGHLHESSS